MDLLILFVVLAFTGCMRAPPPPKGGQDIGGGETLPSTEAEVKEAIDRSWKLLKNPNNSVLDLVIILSMSAESKLDKRFIDLVVKVRYPKSIPEYVRTKNPDLYYYPPLKSDVDAWKNDYLKHSRVVISDKGVCPHAGDRQKDASVSAHKVGATLCIAIGPLTKIPKESLFTAVLPLLIHEAAHLQGFKEEDATYLQVGISKILRQIRTYHSAQETAEVIRGNILDSISLLEKAYELQKKHHNSIKVAFLVSQAIGYLTGQMPNFNFFGHPSMSSFGWALSVQYGDLFTDFITEENYAYVPATLYFVFGADKGFENLTHLKGWQTETSSPLATLKYALKALKNSVMTLDGIIIKTQAKK